MMSRLRLALLFTIALPSVASAHIHLLQPKSRTDLATGDQKEQHCGLAAYSRAAHPERVTYFKPGEKIKVMWQETIEHTGWYRIALQPNGEVFAYPPPGNAPGNFPTVNQTGVTDATTGMTVLLDRIPDGAPGTTLMAEVTLPNTECANCTLQFTQFMTDRATYTFTNGGAVYFNCADIVISNSPPPTPGTPDAGPVTPTPDGGMPTDDNDVKGGCSTSGASGLGLLAAIGLVGLVARRRRSQRV
jgi:MYXO-CTERM domain-containing protein